MTRRAICFAFDVIFSYKFFACFELVRGRLPSHAKDLVKRTHIFCRVTMTIETPRHLERRGAHHQRHLVNLTMTCRTANALIYMNAVVEIYKIGKLIDAIPLNRHIRARARKDGRQHRARSKKLRMTIHARFRRRHSCKG